VKKKFLAVSAEDFPSLKEALESQFLEEFVQRAKRYQAEEMLRCMKAMAQTTVTLDREFAARGIDFAREILPLFMTTYTSFVSQLTALKGANEVVKEYQSRVNRYDGSVRLITEDESPFPQHVKTYLKVSHAIMKGFFNRKRREELHQRIRWEKQGILSSNFTKDPHKHPAWQQLEVDLFSLLTQQGMSENQTYKLIAQLFRHYIPHWFTPRSPEATIRLSIKSRLKKQRLPKAP